jgi:hypothetical protein
MVRFALIPATVVLLLLAGCSAGVANPTPTPAAESSSPTPTAAPIPVEQTALVLEVGGLVVIDSTGASTSVPWTSGDAVIDVIVEVFGPAPTPEVTPKGDFYDWPEGVSVFRQGVTVMVGVTVSEVNGYEVRTVEGVTVGSSRAEVEALGVHPIDYDGDGDGLPDAAGLGPVEEPGTESLTNPGAVGTSYVMVRFAGDVVVSISAPAGDWRDL